MAIGTDSQVRIDPFEELREMETLARREGQTRDALLAGAGGDLWGAVARAGRESLGLDPAGGGEIELDLDHPDLAGVAAEDLPLALASCASAGVVARSRPGAERGPRSAALIRIALSGAGRGSLLDRVQRRWARIEFRRSASSSPWASNLLRVRR